MPSSDYDNLTDTELRSRLTAVGLDLPISINRDFLVRKLQQAEEGSPRNNAGSNGTPTSKKRLSLHTPTPTAQVPNRRLARNSIAVNQNHQPPAAPITQSRTQPSASVTPPRVRRQTPPRQVNKSTIPTSQSNSPTPLPQVKPAANQQSRGKIPFTNKYVNVEESDEDHSEEERETVQPRVPFTSSASSRNSTSLQAQATLRKPVVVPPPPPPASSNSNYMKLFSDQGDTVSRNRLSYATRITTRSSGKFSSDDDDSDEGASTFRPKRAARPSLWLKVKDYVTNNVPNVVLTVTITFFLMMVAIYLFNKFQNASTDPLVVVDSRGKKLDTYLPICGPDGTEDNACIPEDYIPDTKKLFHELREELNERRRMIDCKSPDDDLAADYLSLGKTKSLLYRLSSLNKPRIDAIFQHLLYFIIENPKLGLTVETELSNGTRTQLSKVDEIVHADVELYITTTSLERAWYCSVFKTIWNTISYASLILVVAFIIIGAYQIYVTIQNHRMESKRQLFSMVEDILSLLQEHHENSQNEDREPLAIHHLRDNLIQPSERTPEKMRIWTDAIEYILSNESRVREEMHHIRGEEYRVLKWLPTVSPKRPISPGSFSGWQGQAFEIVDGSPNSLPLKIPTNCLKVRHMFDCTSPLTAELKTKIEASLQTKAEIKLKHIGYDNHNDSCVYIKCFSKDDAKTAYVNLHGWWYNGKLLSVKFLREQRYDTRFPESVGN